MVKRFNLRNTLLLLCAVSLTGCEGLQFSINITIPRTAQESNTARVPLRTDTRLVVDNPVGSVRVVVDPTATEATVEITRIAAADSQEAADALLPKIVVAVTPPSDDDNTLRVVATLPPEAETKDNQIDISVNSDEVTIVRIDTAQLSAQVRLRITLPSEHSVDIRQGKGSVRLVDIDRQSMVDVGTGSIRSIAASTRALGLMIDTGSVDVEAHEGGLNVIIGTGSLEAEVLDIDDTEEIVVRIEVGGLELRLPDDVDADLKAISELGRVDFNKRDFDSTSDREQTDRTVDVQLNDGGARIDLRTELGNIEVRDR